MPKMTFAEFSDSQFWQGFHWALSVVEAMGHKVEMEKMLTLLREVAKGEATLRPTPEETAQHAAEANVSYAGQELMKAVNSGYLRRLGDISDRESAQQYVDVLDAY